MDCRGRRELTWVSDTFRIFIIVAHPRERVKTHQDTYVVRQLSLHKAATRKMTVVALTIS